MLTTGQRVYLERKLGRPLTVAELHIDVAGIDRELEQAKVELERTIETAKRRSVRRWLRGGQLRLEPTKDMVAVLASLYRAGSSHAAREMRSMGVEQLRRFAVNPVDALDQALARLRDGLARLQARVEREAVAVEIGGLAAAAVRRRLLQVPGARDAAGRVVSSAFAAGLAATYEKADAEGLFDGWQYTAVLDANTCDECRAKDGRTYRTLAEAYHDLPSFGPNPLCHGNGRCRCRLVPSGAAKGHQASPAAAPGKAHRGGGGGRVPPAPPGSREPPGRHPRRIPGAEDAMVPKKKLQWLVTGKHAHFFRRTLGFKLDDTEEIERQLRRKLPTVPGAPGRLYRSGNRAWVAIIVLDGPLAAGDTTTFWELLPSGIPVLVSARATKTKDRLDFNL